MADQLSLLAPLEPDPPEMRPYPGMAGGPDVTEEEILAVVTKLLVWCGPHGWRAPLAVLNLTRMTPILHEGRLRVGLLLDLGPAKLLRVRDEDAEAP